MPLGQIGKEFWPKSNVGVCAWKLVHGTLRLPRKNCKILLKKKKKNSYQFCTKTTLGQIGQEFCPKSNLGMCEWKLVDITLRSPRMKCKIL